MRVFIGAAALCVMLAAAPTYAQATAPAPPAPQPQAAAPAVQRPFPAGTKYAFVNIQRIAAESAAGKTLAGKVQALNQQKVNELNEKNKALQATQQKLEAGATVLSPTAVAQLQKDVERQQIDIQRFTEDAQQDVTNLQTQLQEEFQVRLSPIIQQVAMEHGLHMLFSVVDSGLVWADQALDITTEVIQKFDAAPASALRPATPPAPAPKPAAAAPAPKPAAPAPKPANP
ncbi:MAG TPA: OmpH family outer membrane protein [Candidatus Limnocylindrales bacterium]|nr:OmpH family outer membrane protein [Candidatus Limnocylindrales bacterium]